MLIIAVMLAVTTTVASSSPAAAAGGCKTVSASYRQATLLGFEAYTFQHTLSFCWDGRRVTKIYNRRWAILRVDGAYYWRGVIGNHSGTYADGNAWSHMKGQVDNCIIRYGCILTSYPWVTIYPKKNGSWTSTSGPR